MELMYHSVQHKNVLITQQKRRWNQSNPDWFPAYDERYYERAFGIYVGKKWQDIKEQNGWIFLAKDNLYTAIRILLAKTDDDPLAWAKGTSEFENKNALREDGYSWNKDKSIIRFTHKFSPAIIEVGRKKDYSNFDNLSKLF